MFHAVLSSHKICFHSKFFYLIFWHFWMWSNVRHNAVKFCHSAMSIYVRPSSVESPPKHDFWSASTILSNFSFGEKTFKLFSSLPFLPLFWQNQFLDIYGCFLPFLVLLILVKKLPPPRNNIPKLIYTDRIKCSSPCWFFTLCVEQGIRTGFFWKVWKVAKSILITTDNA